MRTMHRRMVVTGAHALANGVTTGLRNAGHRVVQIAPELVANASADSLACNFASEAEINDVIEAAEQAMGGIDQVVHAWVHPAVLSERSFCDIAIDEWIDACEGSLEAGWWTARHLSAPLQRSGGGSVVFLIPSIALAGSASYSQLATVGEGLRVLAKGCGRQWAGVGITVNSVATAPHHWVSDEAGATLTKAISLSTPAFGHQGDAAGDLAPLVAALATPDTHFLTASTLVADGGLWMGL